VPSFKLGLGNSILPLIISWGRAKTRTRRKKKTKKIALPVGTGETEDPS
jgi:hypothetical protein